MQRPADTIRGAFVFVEAGMQRLLFTFVVVSAAVSLSAQPQIDRNKARELNQLGWEYMRAEKFDNAVTAFRQSVEIDPAFDMPWYGLGRAHLALKQFVSAVSALTRCRDLYVQQAGKQFTNQQEAQRFRRDRMMELDEMLRELQTGPQTVQRQDQIRQVQNHKRQLQDILSRGDNISIENTVPAWVSLSLGSAYFRSGKLADAEREFKAAIQVDNKSGEALNNLAVVYLETARFDLAKTTIEAAKKTGFRVNPELERAIKDKAKD